MQPVKCNQVYEWLQAYLDTEVTAEEERMVERHIRACPTCRQRLLELAQTINQLRESERLTPRQDFTKQLWETLQREKQHKRG